MTTTTSSKDTSLAAQNAVQAHAHSHQGGDKGGDAKNKDQATSTTNGNATTISKAKTATTNRNPTTNGNATTANGGDLGAKSKAKTAAKSPKDSGCSLTGL